ncbi:MAG: hypothetical protein HYY37_00835 [Candidatus Aenigmarchaeota archaeon]|nr:hypothetical protein [Candidatus Aenigmarchaeota archaeon]
MRQERAGTNRYRGAPCREDFFLSSRRMRIAMSAMAAPMMTWAMSATSLIRNLFMLVGKNSNEYQL